MNQDFVNYFNELSQNFRIASDEEYKYLVHPLDLQNTPIHNWYRFKEGYSPL